MPNFVFAYHGGKKPESPEEGAKLMAKWKAWIGGLGDAVVNPGTPLGMSKTVNSSGVSDDGGSNPLLVEGGLEDYGEARHKVGKEIIAGSEAVRKVITSRNPVTRFLVLAVLRTASFLPALQRQFAKKILYG